MFLPDTCEKFIAWLWKGQNSSYNSPKCPLSQMEVFKESNLSCFGNLPFCYFEVDSYCSMVVLWPCLTEFWGHICRIECEVYKNRSRALAWTFLKLFGMMPILSVQHAKVCSNEFWVFWTIIPFQTRSSDRAKQDRYISLPHFVIWYCTRTSRMFWL